MRKLTSMLSIVFLIGLLATTPVLATTDGSSNSLSSLSQFEKSSNEYFRKVYDLEKLESVSVNSINNKSKETYGVYLTNDEMELLKDQDVTIEYARDLQVELITKHKDSFGGMYFDRSLNNGTIRVGLVNNSSKSNIHSEIINAFPRIDKLQIFEVDTPLSELENYQEQINQFIIENKWTHVSTDISIPDNKVIIGVPSEDSFVRKEIEERFKNNYYIINSEFSPITLTSRTAYTRPLIGGLEIVPPNNLPCTGAFTGWLNTGEVAYVTAAHCAELGQVYTQGGSVIGMVERRHYQGTADAAAIVIGQSNTATSPYLYQNGVFESTESISSEIIGQTVCKSGRTTEVTCGPLITPYDSGAPGGTFLTGLRSIAAYAYGGDSGAPTYIPNEFGSHRLTGVLSGTKMVGTEPRFLYSHIQNVVSHLGITSVRLDY
ncbi:S1 family peptidase [Cohnella cholangitidis]|uniref:Uncharacterized protein n=1 Tax=Cohnella cholangitidis TaxID=2598458 RepID=A0A7G5BWU1_9BACL|nr:S1 family peptidase [Cohnella cholangitidis]QMV41425.1 hypothetical protein FPL14_09640 [Cohnella cholangitidis]